MSDALLTCRLHCWPRTGSATLLPNLGNLPTNSSVMSSQPTHVFKQRSHIKARDLLDLAAIYVRGKKVSALERAGTEEILG